MTTRALNFLHRRIVYATRVRLEVQARGVRGVRNQHPEIDSLKSLAIGNNALGYVRWHRHPAWATVGDTGTIAVSVRSAPVDNTRYERVGEAE